MTYTWTNVTANIGFDGSFPFQSVACDSIGQKLIVVTTGADVSNAGIVLSDNGGTTWTPNTGSDGDFLVCASSSDGNTLTAAEHVPVVKIWTSTNRGSSWIKVTPGTASRISSLSISGDGSIIVAGDNSNTDKKLYISTNTGVSFAASAAFGVGFWTYAKVSRDGSTIYASNGTNLFKSTDNGASVVDVSPPSGVGDICCSSNGSVVIAAGFNGKQYVSTNSGASWTDKGNSPDTHTGDNASLVCSDDGSVIFYASLDNVPMFISSDIDTSWVSQSTGNHSWNSTCCSANGLAGAAVTRGSSNTQVWVAVGSAPTVSSGRYIDDAEIKLYSYAALRRKAAQKLGEKGAAIRWR